MLKLNGLFASKKQIAGLDIGSSSIKVAEIAEGPDGYVLQNYASVPLAKGIITDGLIVNPNALVERTKELLKISRCKARTVVTSLSGYSVIAKKISFPSMDEESLRELISDEIENAGICDNARRLLWVGRKQHVGLRAAPHPLRHRPEPAEIGHVLRTGGNHRIELVPFHQLLQAGNIGEHGVSLGACTDI